MTTILQVPINKDLRDKADRAAEKMGFSSLQESVRLFLNQLAANQIKVTFEPKTIKLSPRAEKRYNKMIEEIETGKLNLKTFKTVKALMEDLNQ